MRTSPENTMEALRRAQAEGVDGIEFDVQLSADGELFLFHDDNARRVCGRDVPVASLKWRELKGLQVFGRHPIAHIDEALAAMESWRGAEIFFDLHQPRADLAEAVARKLAVSSVRERACVLDFYKSRRLLAAAKKAEPSVRIAVMPGPPWNTRASCELGASAISLGWDGRLTRALYRSACLLYDVGAEVGLAKASGVAVSGGVAYDPEDVRYFLAQGMDGIWTDDLAMVRDALFLPI